MGHLSEEHKSKISKALKGRPFTQEHRAKIGASQKGKPGHLLGKHHTKEARAKMSISRTGKRRSEEATRKMMLAMNIKPNIAERKLIDILNKNWPSEWKYVGDGQVSFDGLNPDFINCNSKKLIIELFGDYWHSPEITDSWRRSELGRMMVFSQFGYRTLIIWERELQDESEVISKIKQFQRLGAELIDGD